MSALAKPLNHFTASTTPLKFVASEHLASVEKLNIENSPGNPKNRYQINFHYQYPDGGTKVTTIEFTTEAARDTSLTNFQTANSIAIA